MSDMVAVSGINLGSTPASIEGVPDECPICHFHVRPVFVVGRARARSGQIKAVEAVYQCAREDCQRLFVALHEDFNSPHFRLTRTTPTTAIPATLSEEVAALSPTFVEVYNQALAAESHELHQLTGIGLRKALEFLIKDFASHRNPAEIEKIRKTALSKCIDTYADDPNLKQVAKRAAWLGNDETHYVRKWEERDIEDLKRLIRLTVNWIENVLLTEKYIQEMPEP